LGAVRHALMAVSNSHAPSGLALAIFFIAPHARVDWAGAIISSEKRSSSASRELASISTGRHGAELELAEHTLHRRALTMASGTPADTGLTAQV
jgi:hypothetical protein